MGGTPLRLLRLSAAATVVVSQWNGGAQVGDRPAAGRLARRLVSSGIALPRPGTTTTFSPRDVTVVIPVRDRPEQLQRLLSALAGLACIVVDDASADSPRTAETARRAGAKFIGLATNGGPSVARNAGAAEATTPLVAFVDSDCVPSTGWLSPLLGYFDDPLVAAVAPRIVPAPASTSSSLFRYERVRSSLDRGEAAALVRPRSRVPYVPSAALIIRRNVVALPFFDPDLRGGEDVDLIWRLVEAGWDVRYDPASTVAHEGPRTVPSWLRRLAFYGSTAGPLARRHPGALAPLETSVWTAAVWGLALRRRPVLAAGTLGVSALVLGRRLHGLVDRPLYAASRITAGGAAKSALPALGGLARAWSPALVLGLASRRTRRVAVCALLAPAVSDWITDPGELDAGRYGALHVADDVAYGIGLWLGCVRARTVQPLLPRIVLRSGIWSRRSLFTQLGGARREEGAGRLR